MVQPNHLKRILGVSFGVAIVIGGTIGIGILRMPATVASYITNPYLFIAFWIIGGLIALLGAFIYAELSTRYPKAGGPFVLTGKAMGDMPGFVTGWSDWIYNAGSISFLAIAVTEYIGSLAGKALPLGIISSCIILFLAVIQWQGLNLSSSFQKIMSSLKAIALLLFVGGCFIYFFKGSRDTQSTAHFTSSLHLFPAIVLALRAIFITYNGWNTAVYFSEEDKDPSKNIPRSLIWGVLSVMIIYVLVNIGLLAVLPMKAIASSDLPVADAVQKIIGGNSGNIVVIISIISLAGVLNATLLYAPRILFAIARNGLFFKSASTLNKNAIPGTALILTTAVSILFALTGLFNVVVNITALLAMTIDLAVYTSILFVRYKDPAAPPFKAWGYPYTAILMILITLGLITGLFIEDTQNSLYALGILAVGSALYFIFKRSFRLRLIPEPLEVVA
jgi:basic amino acid/polyamine antiporter, APA family